jgi:DNA repair protein RadD
MRFKPTASTDALIRRDAFPEIVSVDVDRVVYKQHQRVGGLHSLKVCYHCGLRVFHEWVCLEHDGYPLHRAHDWWREHASTKPPETVYEAFKRLDELRQPKRVKVWINRQFPEVKGHEF